MGGMILPAVNLSIPAAPIRRAGGGKICEQSERSKLQRWVGLALSWLAVLFLLFDSTGKLLQVQPVIDGTLQLGYPRDSVFGLGLILLSCVLVYAVPRTSVLGALLLTGYLGGAVATHVRVANPLVQPRPLSHLRRGIPVGRTHSARRTGPRAAADSEGVMNQVRSKDGTPIAYERSGSGPALILVDGALCSRAFGPSPKLAPLLAQHFTVFAYDRRGRGQSGDTQPYSPAREVEDIAALIQEAGGSASLLGLSSGGALALQAAAADLAINKVVAYEPPYVDDAGQRGGDAYEGQLKRLVASGDRGGAVKYFMKDMVGVPAPFVVLMRLMPWIWRKLAAVAHTLPYDAALMTGFRIPRTSFAFIRVPALVMNGSKTDQRLKDAARAIAAVIPGARHSELAGQTHNVKPDVLTPAVVEFLRS